MPSFGYHLERLSILRYRLMCHWKRLCRYLPGHEPGTVGGERMLASERAENWLFHHGERSSREAVDIIREVRETSAPSDGRWRRRVLVQGAAVLADAYRAAFGTPRLERAAR